MSKIYRVRLKRTYGTFGKVLQIGRIFLFLVFGTSLVCAIVVGGLFFWFFQGLPSSKELLEYRPYVISRVYDRNGIQIGEIKRENERRILVSIDDLPKHVIWAFVSAEDKNFFEHQGLDYIGIFRAFIKNLIAGRIVEGGSTITQQVIKAILLTPKKSIERKIKEAILAQKIERELPKEKILELYLNQIYFGHGAYGIEVASQTFFGKHASELTISEAALLAGLPKAPSHYSPYRYPDVAESRRRYVLNRMLEDARISQEEFNSSIESLPNLKPLGKSQTENLAPYFFELVFRQLVELFGEDEIYKAGWEIHTTLDVNLQKYADQALRTGLRELDKRQGFRGAIENVPKSKWAEKLNKLERSYDGLQQALVVEVNDRSKEVIIDLGTKRGIIPYSGLKWAFSVRTKEGEIKYLQHIPSNILKVGDVIWVKRSQTKDNRETYELEQIPEVQGAVFVMNPKTREVLAVSGGYDYFTSSFNRAVQAKRQPGSAFKPIVYSAAFNYGFTPASTFVDTALVFADGWSPKNYDIKFHGYVTLRKALALSLNTVTVRLASEVGAENVARYARSLGVKLPPKANDLTLALGAYEIRPIELANTYAVFASGGIYAKPYLIKEIRDFEGNVIVRTELSEETNLDIASSEQTASNESQFSSATALKEKLIDKSVADSSDKISDLFGFDFVRKTRVISPQIAYLTHSLLESVVREGTGARASSLGKPCAGKTGTTNDSRDAWFIGYTPDILCAVWVGFDDARSLGPREQGAKAALPIWLYFMREATKDKPSEGFPMPPGITLARIDRKTGLLATSDSQDAYFEVFVEGTAPKEFVSTTPSFPFEIPSTPVAPEDLSDL